MIATTTYNNWTPDLFEGNDIPEQIKFLHQAYEQSSAPFAPPLMLEPATQPKAKKPKPKLHQPIAGSTTATPPGRTTPVRSIPTQPSQPKATVQPEENQAALFTILNRLSERMDKWETTNSPGNQTPVPSLQSKKSSASTTSTPSSQTSQDLLNAELVHTLKVIKGDAPASTPAPLQVFPKHILQSILTTHDVPTANSKVKAAVLVTKSLLQMYTMGISLDDSEDKLFPVAALMTQAIQHAICADAFANTQPHMKEKRALLSTVLKGTNLASKNDIVHSYEPPPRSPNYRDQTGRRNQEAYSPRHNPRASPRAKGRGGGRHNNNWRQQPPPNSSGNSAPSGPTRP